MMGWFRGRNDKIFIAILTFLYFIGICYMCFGPQHQLNGLETPGIQHYGRLVVLLTPFNSLVHLNEVRGWSQGFWVVGQNLANIFLLYPLILGLLFLFRDLRKRRRVLWLSFGISLSIEVTQLVLDALVNANRVFEIDDLWTNTLGGLLAYETFRLVVPLIVEYCKKIRYNEKQSEEVQKVELTES